MRLTPGSLRYVRKAHFGRDDGVRETALHSIGKATHTKYFHHFERSKLRSTTNTNEVRNCKISLIVLKNSA